MDSRQRIAQQRALARAAIGQLRAVEELFGIEDGAVAGDGSAHAEFAKKVDEFEAWVFDASSIA